MSTQCNKVFIEADKLLFSKTKITRRISSSSVKSWSVLLISLPFLARVSVFGEFVLSLNIYQNTDHSPPPIFWLQAWYLNSVCVCVNINSGVILMRSRCLFLVLDLSGVEVKPKGNKFIFNGLHLEGHSMNINLNKGIIWKLVFWSQRCRKCCKLAVSCDVIVL